MSNDDCKLRTPRKPKLYTIKTIDSRSHAFNVGIATDYSPDMALWLGHLAFWTEKNLANNKHIHDGLAWCYDTLDAICDYFPYYSRRQIETIINNSVNEGLVQRGNYNHTGYDRTVWYAITPKAYFYFQHLLSNKYLERLFLSISQICEMDFTEYVNGFPRSVTTIPDTDPDTDPDKESGGKTPSQHTVISFPSKSEQQAKKSFEDESAKSFFNTKFVGLTVTYEKLFNECKEHYDSKNQWVTIKKWKLWLEREKLENYTRTSTPKESPKVESPDDKMGMFTRRQWKIISEYNEAMKYIKVDPNRLNLFLTKDEQEEAQTLIAQLKASKAKESQSCQPPSQPNNARKCSLELASNLVSALTSSQQGS